MVMWDERGWKYFMAPRKLTSQIEWVGQRAQRFFLLSTSTTFVGATICYLLLAVRLSNHGVKAKHGVGGRQYVL